MRRSFRVKVKVSNIEVGRQAHNSRERTPGPDRIRGRAVVVVREIHRIELTLQPGVEG